MTKAFAEQVRWTITDLEGFPDNSNRYEIIDGELFVTRAPHLDHQDVIGATHGALLQWSLETKLGRPYITPGIIFSPSDAVIPDLIWISYERRSQLIDSSGDLAGAPELIVEVLSNTETDKKRDRETKLKLYSVQGVSEYWIIDREQQLIEVYQHENGVLKKAITLFKNILTSPLLPGFTCQLSSILVEC